MRLHKVYHRFSLLSLSSSSIHPPFSLSLDLNVNLNAPFPSSSLRAPGYLRTHSRNASKPAMTASRFHHLVPVNSALSEAGTAGSGSANASATVTEEDDGNLLQEF